MIFIFDKQSELLKQVLSNDSPDAIPYWNDEHYERLSDGLLTYKFDTKMEADISANDLIAIKDLDGNFVLFYATEVTDENSGTQIKHVSCENAALELNGSIIRPTTLNNVNAEQAITNVLNNTRWQPGIIEWLGTQTIEFKDYTTVIAAIQKMAKQFGGEFRYRVEVDGSQISGRYIDLLKQRGRNNGKRFEYTKDLTKVQRTENSQQTVTALIGLGKADQQGNKLTFKDVVWSKANGDPTDKPAGQDYVFDENAYQVWGRGLRQIVGIYEDSNETNPYTLLQKTWNELQRRKNSTYTYNLDVAVLERIAGYEHETVRLGDTVAIIDKTFDPPLYLQARVIELTISYSDPTKDKCTLGYYFPTFIDKYAIVSEIQQTLSYKSGIWDGKETIYKGNTAPNNPMVNDLWLDTSVNPNVWKRYDGTNWVKATPTRAQELAYSSGQTIEELKPAQAGADVTSQNTAADTSKVNGIPSATVIDNINTAQNTAIDAKNTANTAQNTAIDAKNTANTAQNTATDAKNTANTALDVANGKNTVYYQPTEPTGGTYKVNDIWFDTANGYTMHYWNGSGWTQGQFNSAAISELDAGKITTGTMSALRIKGGTLTLGGNNNQSGILEIKDDNGVTQVRGDKAGVSVNQANFIAYDNNNKQYTIQNYPNLINDHSFELQGFDPNSVDGYGTYAWKPTPDTGNAFYWNTSNPANTRLAVAYNTEAQYNQAYSGLTAAVLRNYETYYWYQSFMLRPSYHGDYTVSCYVSTFPATTGTTAPFIEAHFYGANYTEIGSPYINGLENLYKNDYNWVRMVSTIPASSIPSNTVYIQIRIAAGTNMSNVDTPILCDAVQVVASSFPCPYQTEEETYHILSQSGSAFFQKPVQFQQGMKVLHELTINYTNRGVIQFRKDDGTVLFNIQYNTVSFPNGVWIYHINPNANANSALVLGTDNHLYWWNNGGIKQLA